jgi:hypothetical protein
VSIGPSQPVFPNQTNSLSEGELTVGLMSNFNSEREGKPNKKYKTEKNQIIKGRVARLKYCYVERYLVQPKVFL